MAFQDSKFWQGLTASFRAVLKPAGFNRLHREPTKHPLLKAFVKFDHALYRLAFGKQAYNRAVGYNVPEGATRGGRNGREKSGSRFVEPTRELSHDAEYVMECVRTRERLLNIPKGERSPFQRGHLHSLNVALAEGGYFPGGEMHYRPDDRQNPAGAADWDAEAERKVSTVAEKFTSESKAWSEAHPETETNTGLAQDSPSPRRTREQYALGADF